MDDKIYFVTVRFMPNRGLALLHSLTGNTPMQLEHNACLITCIVPSGSAHSILEKIYQEKNITRIGIYHARGVGGSGMYRSSFAESIEKDILAVITGSEQADEIFEYLYDRAEIYLPHRGFMYMQRLKVATCFLRGVWEV
jgi:hypothetical protein